MGFEPTTPGLKVTPPGDRGYCPRQIRRARPEEAAVCRILSSRTRYLLTRGFYLDAWSACNRPKRDRGFHHDVHLMIPCSSDAAIWYLSTAAT